MNADVQARLHDVHVKENRYEYWCAPCREPLPLVSDNRPEWVKRMRHGELRAKELGA